MSIEIDRRIAEEVMKEPYPEEPDFKYLNKARINAMAGEGDPPSPSSGGNWVLAFRAPWKVEWSWWWEPVRFSTSLHHVMRAVKKHYADDPVFSAEWDLRNEEGMNWVASRYGYHGWGDSLPEALCRLMLDPSKYPESLMEE